MKWICLVCLLVANVLASRAQTTGEWLKQKKTRIQYLAQQIAAFQVYTGGLKKGYQVVKGGLNMINDVKHGDFNLHHNYFNSLLSVSSSVKGYGKVKGITLLQMKILAVNHSVHKLFASSSLSSSEQEYLETAMNNVLQKCSEDMDKLSTLTSLGSAQMTEEQRLNAIDELYKSVQDKYSFAVHEQQEAQLLFLSRSKDKNNSTTLQSIYGLK